LRRLEGNLRAVVFEGIALELAQKLNISKAFYGLSPSEKTNKIIELQSYGHNRKVVCMIGDGINDAPALAQSDVGIALSTGTSIALESADLILGSGDIADILYAREEAVKTYRTIQANTYIALGINIVLLFGSLVLFVVTQNIILLSTLGYFVAILISSCTILVYSAFSLRLTFKFK
jgi:P-type E1-E2 ATPase